MGRIENMAMLSTAGTRVAMKEEGVLKHTRKHGGIGTLYFYPMLL
jgi:hypothetical protein